MHYRTAKGKAALVRLQHASCQHRAGAEQTGLKMDFKLGENRLGEKMVVTTGGVKEGLCDKYTDATVGTKF